MNKLLHDRLFQLNLEEKQANEYDKERIVNKKDMLTRWSKLSSKEIEVLVKNHFSIYNRLEMAKRLFS